MTFLRCDENLWFSTASFLSTSCLAIKPFAVIPIVCYLIKVKKLITRCDRDNDKVDDIKAKTKAVKHKKTFTIIMNNDIEVCKC